MNQRIRRKHLKRQYGAVLNQIQHHQQTQNISYSLMYQPKTQYHDAYLWLYRYIDDGFSISTEVAYDIGLTNESIDWCQQAADLPSSIGSIMHTIVDYYAKQNRPWKIGSALLLKGDTNDGR